MIIQWWAILSWSNVVCLFPMHRKCSKSTIINAIYKSAISSVTLRSYIGKVYASVDKCISRKYKFTKFCFSFIPLRRGWVNYQLKHMETARCWFNKLKSKDKLKSAKKEGNSRQWEGWVKYTYKWRSTIKCNQAEGCCRKAVYWKPLQKADEEPAREEGAVWFSASFIAPMFW